MSSAPDNRRAPVGVFDSGVGGLSVLAEIRRRLPAEELIYVADSGYAPYGDRSRSYIEARSVAISDFLLGAGAKAIVVACNTATAVIGPLLRTRLQLPVVAMEPAVKPAAAATRSGTIGVLATRRTLASERFARLVAEHAAAITVRPEACSDLVELVERGVTDGPEAEAAVGAHLDPLIRAGADVIVLGCTHFHFLRPVVAARAGAGIAVIDPGAAVARELARRLAQAGIAASGHTAGPPRVFVSGELARGTAVVNRLWPQPLVVAALPAEYALAPAG
jgi:glutamate racemase